MGATRALRGGAGEVAQLAQEEYEFWWLQQFEALTSFFANVGMYIMGLGIPFLLARRYFTQDIVVQIPTWAPPELPWGMFAETNNVLALSKIYAPLPSNLVSVPISKCEDAPRIPARSHVADSKRLHAVLAGSDRKQFM